MSLSSMMNKEKEAILDEQVPPRKESEDPAAAAAAAAAADLSLLLVERNDLSSSVNDFDKYFSLGLTSHLYGLYQSNKLTDIRVECGAETFQFHKPVLSFSSGYFQTLFALESSTDMNSHTLDFAVEPHTFRILATSFYTGIVADLSEANAIALLQASFVLEAHSANDQIMAFLQQKLSIDNCLDIWLACEYCFDADLKSKATAKVGRHLSQVCTTDAFLQLHVDKLVELLSEDGLQVPNEMVVYSAAMGWIQHDLPNREGNLYSVLRVVRFHYLSREFLTDVVAEEQLVLNNNDVMGLYSKALQYKLKSPRAKTDVKRRDFFAHSVVGGCEKFAKEQQRVALRDESPDSKWNHWIHVHVIFPLQYFQQNVWNKYIATPVITWASFCKEDVVEKHITGPLSRAPCMRPQEEETIPGVRNENVFEKYIVRPIVESPCIPDSDDEYEEEEKERNATLVDENAALAAATTTKEEDKPLDDSILQDSVWTKIDAAVEYEPPSKQANVAVD